jgi:hypothetical protein
MKAIERKWKARLSSQAGEATGIVASNNHSIDMLIA